MQTATDAQPFPEDLTPATISAGLATHNLPDEIICLAQVGSTMDVARDWLRNAPPAARSLLVQTDEQTAGRGRMGRPWTAPPASALLFSLAPRPPWLTPATTPTLIWLAATSLCAAIENETGLQARLKWPNDVLLPAPDLAQTMQAGSYAGWHKVAGVLIELGGGQPPEWAIIGCGLNVSASPPLQAGLRYPATHLSRHTGRPVARLPLLRSIIRHCDAWYGRLADGDTASLFAAWRERLVTIGQTVEVQTAGGPLHGYAEDVEPDGALRLRAADGTLQIISHGDVS